MPTSIRSMVWPVCPLSHGLCLGLDNPICIEAVTSALRCLSTGALKPKLKLKFCFKSVSTDSQTMLPGPQMLPNKIKFNNVFSLKVVLCLKI